MIGAHRPRRWLAWAAIAGALAIALGSIALLWHMSHRTRVVRLVTGPRRGNSYALGQILASTVGRDGRRIEMQVVESTGTSANVGVLERGEAQFGLVPGNSMEGPSVRLVAPLYREVLQIAARTGTPVERPADLHGKRIALGPRGSGSDVVMRQVLSHFGLGESDVSFHNLPYDDAVTAIERGELDGVALLSTVRTPIIERLLARPDVDLVSLSDPDTRGSYVEGVRVDAPYLSPAVIPEHAYGERPRKATGTVGAPVLLVARSDVPDDIVESVTRAIFENRSSLARVDSKLSRLTERFEAGDIAYPQHPGAVRFFRRNEPHPITVWADTLSLGLTLAATLWSLASALRTGRQRAKRHVILDYCREILDVVRPPRGLPSALSTRERRERINGIRRRACDDAMSGKLDPDEAYTTCQRLAEIELSLLDKARDRSIAL